MVMKINGVIKEKIFRLHQVSGFVKFLWGLMVLVGERKGEEDLFMFMAKLIG